jgi:hypothetical protein
MKTRSLNRIALLAALLLPSASLAQDLFVPQPLAFLIGSTAFSESYLPYSGSSYLTK